MNCTTDIYFVINLSNLVIVAVYNQKYRILFSASLAGVMIEHIRQQTRPSLVRVRGTGQTFLFAFETNGRNFKSTVIFFYNSNVKLKYIFEYLC